MDNCFRWVSRGCNVYSISSSRLLQVEGIAKEGTISRIVSLFCEFLSTLYAYSAETSGWVLWLFVCKSMPTGSSWTSGCQTLFIRFLKHYISQLRLRLLLRLNSTTNCASFVRSIDSFECKSLQLDWNGMEWAGAVRLTTWRYPPTGTLLLNTLSRNLCYRLLSETQ